MSSLSANICQQMESLSITNIQHGQWNMLQVHSKAQRLLNMKLIYLVSRFRNLAALTLLVPDLNYSSLKFVYESCTKLTDLSICTHGFHFITELQNVKRNCKEIKRLRLVFQHSKAIIQSKPLQGLCKMLPGVSIDVIYINGDQTFSAVPRKYDFLQF